MLKWIFMEEIGVVNTVEGHIAKVAVAKKSMCEHCTAGTCHMTDEGAELEALNNAGARAGQRVRVVMRPYTYLKGSLVVYGLPAIALVIGAVAGKELGSSGVIRGMDPELLSALFAFGFFAVSFFFIKLWSSRAEKKTKYTPIIEEILKDQ
jgi:sigma-E factor negative regulatory protein RseC